MAFDDFFLVRASEHIKVYFLNSFLPGKIQQEYIKLERRTFLFMADTTNAQKYKGYDLDRNSSHRRRKNQPWFWKVLGISLLLTIIILAGVVFGMLHKTHKNAKHMEEINAANNIEVFIKRP